MWGIEFHAKQLMVRPECRSVKSVCRVGEKTLPRGNVP